jgi:hypothetical protein
MIRLIILLLCFTLDGLSADCAEALSLLEAKWIKPESVRIPKGQETDVNLFCDFTSDSAEITDFIRKNLHRKIVILAPGSEKIECLFAQTQRVSGWQPTRITLIFKDREKALRAANSLRAHLEKA